MGGDEQVPDDGANAGPAWPPTPPVDPPTPSGAPVAGGPEPPAAPGWTSPAVMAPVPDPTGFSGGGLPPDPYGRAGGGGTPPPARWRGVLLGPVDGTERPAPTLTSMIAVGAGLLAAGGLFFVLGELDSFDQRTVGLVISLLFLALGVVVSVINRSSRAAVAGVALSVAAVVPLTAFLFANTDVVANWFGVGQDGRLPDDFNPYDGLRGVVVLMLLTAAALWLLGYVVGPGRRYGIYLGGALLAVFLVPMAWLQIGVMEDTFTAYRSMQPSFDSPDITVDPNGDFSSDFDQDFTFEEPDVDDPSTKLGVIALAFGAAYLALAAWRDARGDARMATAFLAPALIALNSSTGTLEGHLGWVGYGLFLIAVGAAIMAVGLRGQRRFSSWIGIASIVLGVGWLVANALADSPRAIGGLLTLIGVVTALAVGRGSSTGGTPAAAEAPIGPGPAEPGAPAPWAAPTPTFAPAGPATPPSGPTPSSTPPTYGSLPATPPTFQPPPTPPSAPPGPTDPPASTPPTWP